MQLVLLAAIVLYDTNNDVIVVIAIIIISSSSRGAGPGRARIGETSRPPRAGGAGSRLRETIGARAVSRLRGPRRLRAGSAGPGRAAASPLRLRRPPGLGSAASPGSGPGPGPGSGARGGGRPGRCRPRGNRRAWGRPRPRCSSLSPAPAPSCPRGLLPRHLPVPSGPPGLLPCAGAGHRVSLRLLCGAPEVGLAGRVCFQRRVKRGDRRRRAGWVGTSCVLLSELGFRHKNDKNCVVRC